MSNFVDKLPTIQKFLSSLTWKKIAQLAVFLLVISLAWATYENRQSIYNFASQDKLSRTSKITPLSKETTDKIDSAVIKSDVILGIQVTLVDFQKNTRNIVYTSLDNEEVKTIFKNFMSQNIAELPMFNNDTVNNKRLVDLINGDYICNPYQEHIGAKLMPETTKYIHSACAVGIPPYYGRFTGIVTVYLKRQPNENESTQIMTLSKNLASEIYENTR